MNKYLLIIDFEATCTNKNEFPRHEMEIIEIGGCVVDMSTHKVVEKFAKFVKPEIHTTLTNFCTDLTTIEQDDVDGADTLDSALRLLAVELKPYISRMAWASWGDFDKNILNRETRNKNIKNPLAKVKHINIKKAFAKQQNFNPCGLGKAITRTGMRFEGIPHQALTDAMNIARLVPFTYTKFIY